ncbi:MAG: helix-turn-helix domain-containing protein, partial [Caldimicrobium sp.]|nr:helix-turn-helix domain-containing protein [Caldimicrobium sp.]
LPSAEEKPSSSSFPSSEDLRIKELEKKAILKALEVAKGNKSQAAKLLGISLKTLYNKLKELNLRD